MDRQLCAQARLRALRLAAKQRWTLRWRAHIGHVATPVRAREARHPFAWRCATTLCAAHGGTISAAVSHRLARVSTDAFDLPPASSVRTRRSQKSSISGGSAVRSRQFFSRRPATGQAPWPDLARRKFQMPADEWPRPTLSLRRLRGPASTRREAREARTTRER